VEATLDLDKTEYGSVDTINRCKTLNFNFVTCFSDIDDGDYIWELYVYLTDTSGVKIVQRIKGTGYEGSTTNHKEKAVSLTLGTAIMPSIYTNSNDLWYYSSAGTFDWEHVQKVSIRLKITGTEAPISDYYGFAIDGLQFEGGYEIKPFEWYSKTLNPPVQDATSIAAYGMHPIHIQDTTISSFDQAQAEGARVIQNMKDPKPTLSVKKVLPETTQLYPSNVVTVASTEYRIKNIVYNWKYGDRKVTNVEYGLIGKTAPLPPIWTMINELRFLVK
jgi:hypothetical protein